MSNRFLLLSLLVALLLVPSAFSALELEELGRHEVTTSAEEIAVQGDYIYLAEESEGLIIFDISDKANPTEVGRYTAAEKVNGVAVDGGYAYVSIYKEGMSVIDISNKANPVAVGSYNHDSENSARKIFVQGDYAYVANGGAGLVILDVSDKANVTLAGVFPTTRSIIGIFVKGDYAYAFEWGGGLAIIDVSDKANPVEVLESSKITKVIEGAAELDGFIYLAAERGGMIILDANDPSDIVEAGLYQADGVAKAVDVEGDYAYLVDRASSSQYYAPSVLKVLDIRDKANPRPVAVFPEADEAWDVVVQDGTIYLLSILHRGTGTHYSMIRIFELTGEDESEDVSFTNYKVYCVDASSGRPLAGCNRFLTCSTKLAGCSPFIAEHGEKYEHTTGADGLSVFTQLPVGVPMGYNANAPDGYYHNTVNEVETTTSFGSAVQFQEGSEGGFHISVTCWCSDSVAKADCWDYLSRDHCQPDFYTGEVEEPGQEGPFKISNFRFVNPEDESEVYPTVQYGQPVKIQFKMTYTGSGEESNFKIYGRPVIFENYKLIEGNKQVEGSSKRLSDFTTPTYEDFAGDFSLDWVAVPIYSGSEMPLCIHFDGIRYEDVEGNLYDENISTLPECFDIPFSEPDSHFKAQDTYGFENFEGTPEGKSAAKAAAVSFVENLNIQGVVLGNVMPYVAMGKGQCYGMSSTASLYQSGLLDKPVNKETIEMDLEDDTDRIYENLVIYQMSQTAHLAEYFLRHAIGWSSSKTRVNSIYNVIRNHQGTGVVYIIKNHAMMAYDVYDISDDLKSFVIYDNNAPYMTLITVADLSTGETQMQYVTLGSSYKDYNYVSDMDPKGAYPAQLSTADTRRALFESIENSLARLMDEGGSDVLIFIGETTIDVGSVLQGWGESGWSTIMSFFSPVDVVIIDEHGRELSAEKNEIPGASFEVINNETVITIPSDLVYDVYFEAYDGGEVSIEVIRDSSQAGFVDISSHNRMDVSVGTSGSFGMSPDTTLFSVEVDDDGDGIADRVVASENELVLEDGRVILDVLVRDEQGQEISYNKNEIPGAEMLDTLGMKMFVVPAGSDYVGEVDPHIKGNFSFYRVTKTDSFNITSIENIEVYSDSEVVIDIPGGSSGFVVKVDSDGDGGFEEELVPTENQHYDVEYVPVEDAWGDGLDETGGDGTEGDETPGDGEEEGFPLVLMVVGIILVGVVFLVVLAGGVYILMRKKKPPKPQSPEEIAKPPSPTEMAKPPVP